VPDPAPHQRRPHPPPAPQPLSWLERGRCSPRLVGGLLRTGHRRHHGTTHPHRPTAQQARQIQQDPPPPALHGRRGSGTGEVYPGGAAPALSRRGRGSPPSPLMEGSGGAAEQTIGEAIRSGGQPYSLPSPRPATLPHALPSDCPLPL